MSTLPVPNEADWGNYKEDLDQNWAHEHYSGRTNDELLGFFQSNPTERTSELRFMPEIPFRYYMLGFRDSVLALDIDKLQPSDASICDASDAASCFLDLIEEKLQKNPSHILPIMHDLLPAVEHLAKNQKKFDADPEIYGDFMGKFDRIRLLLDKARGLVV